MRKYTHAIAFIIATGLLALCSGCISIVTQVCYITGDRNVEDINMIYGGTRGNLRLIHNCFTDGPLESGHGPIMAFFGFIDFLPSLALDTVLLPVTSLEQLFRRNFPPEHDYREPPNHALQRTPAAADRSAQPNPAPLSCGSLGGLNAMEKYRSREVRQQIRRVLLSEWDPIHVKDVPHAQVEYDGYVYGIFRLLLDGATDDEIMDHLSNVETHSMGLRGSNRSRLASVVASLRRITLSDSQNAEGQNA